MKEKDKRERIVLYKNAGGRCYICRQRLRYEQMTVDHVIPKSLFKNVRNKTFVWSVKNKRCCCQRCNADKGNKTLEEYCFFIRKVWYNYPYMSKSKINKLLWISKTITQEAMIRRKKDGKN